MNWIRYYIWHNPVFWILLALLNSVFLYEDIFVQSDWSFLGAPLGLFAMAACLWTAYMEIVYPYNG